MSSIFIKNGNIINEGKTFRGNILIINDRINAIGDIPPLKVPSDALIIDAERLFVIPGVIDAHVHFREPGLTHKADILTESMAGAAGGVTSFMDMPNTIPQTTTLSLLNEKFNLARDHSLINYSFYLGATNTNINEILNADPETTCGIKIFLGASTGNMILSDEKILREILKNSSLLIACHCEDEAIINKNISSFRAKYGDNLPPSVHPLIRDRDACLKATMFITELAENFETRLHILHISTADEVRFLKKKNHEGRKNVTSEACIHHLWFDDTDYNRLGNLIKWNPSVKTRYDREALISGIADDTPDIISTDHAPHTIEEKRLPYLKAPSGGPMIQHSLVAMMELYHKGLISPAKIVEKMCHNPAKIFRIRDRGFIREGYKADICIINPDKPWTVEKKNILYKCRWSPLEGVTFHSRVEYTIVNGNIVYNKGILSDDCRGEKLLFNK